MTTKLLLAKDAAHLEEIHLSGNIPTVNRTLRNMSCAWSPDEKHILLIYYVAHDAYGVLLCDRSKRPLEFRPLLKEPDWDQISAASKAYVDSAKFIGNDEMLVEYHTANGDEEQLHTFKYRIGKDGVSGPVLVR